MYIEYGYGHRLCAYVVWHSKQFTTNFQIYDTAIKRFQVTIMRVVYMHVSIINFRDRSRRKQYLSNFRNSKYSRQQP
jgi:hypothetical protein